MAELVEAKNPQGQSPSDSGQAEPQCFAARKAKNDQLILMHGGLQIRKEKAQEYELLRSG